MRQIVGSIAKVESPFREQRTKSVGAYLTTSPKIMAVA